MENKTFQPVSCDRFKAQLPAPYQTEYDYLMQGKGCDGAAACGGFPARALFMAIPFKVECKRAQNEQAAQLRVWAPTIFKKGSRAGGLPRQ